MFPNICRISDANEPLLSSEIFRRAGRYNPPAAIKLANTEKICELTTPSSTENLELIRAVVVKIAQKAGFAEMAAMQIALAVEEACVNAIKHAHKNNAAKPLRVQIQTDHQKLIVVVSDQGKGFDFQNLKEPDMQEYLAKRRPGGLGIVLMKRLMDEVRFESLKGKGTRVWLVRYLVNCQKQNVH
ncbi:ATP-binding protein [bacterium]|nr:ATP-binding protein [bacterium]